MRQKQVHSENKEINVAGVRKGGGDGVVGGARFQDLRLLFKDFGF